MKYKINHIPVLKGKRPGIKSKKTSVTIHSTANPSSTALNERNWLTNPSNNRSASFHIAVDDKEAIEVLPLDEIAYHSGRSVGNRLSIGIEICESGNRSKTIDNAAKVTASVLKTQGMTIHNLVRHYDWSGKNCPRILNYNNWRGWEEFKNMVQKYLDVLNSDKTNVELVTVPLRLHTHNKDEIKGFKNGGKWYVPVRDFSEMLGYSVHETKDKRVSVNYRK